jgi:CheY-like chemotaxis protein
MLTSFGNRGDVKRLKQVGIKGYLVKPIRQAQLQKAVITAVGHLEEKTGETIPMITSHTIEEANFEHIRVLLVEDNVLNQKVAAKMLQKQNVKIIVAENGRKAVEALASSRFDLVLMDVQMPVMDGYMATKEIRKLEQVTGDHTPIIAMTANTMKGDREKCFDAGMDDFVSKPIIKEDLYSALNRWGKSKKTVAEKKIPAEPNGNRSSEETDPLSSFSEDMFDLSPVLAKFGDDMEFYCELAEIFLKDTPKQISALEYSLKNSNANEVETLAHKLKGTSGNFGINRLYELFAKLQELGKAQRLNEASRVFSQATAVYEQVELALKQSITGSCHS